MVLKVTEMVDMPPGILRDDANAPLYILTLAITPCLASGFEHHMNGGTKPFLWNLSSDQRHPRNI